MSERHRIPVIDRMMEVLACLERSDDGLTTNDLVQMCGVPRSTVYRILNTLEAHHVVRRSHQGAYRLGPRLLGLAARVPEGASRDAVAAAAKPHMRRLAAELGETAKLSVFDRDAALCIATAEGNRPFSVRATVGGRYPIHAGGASKVLLAALEPERQAAILARPLDAFTSRTVTDPAALAAELAAIRAQGWGEDRGEYNLTVRALAAPVRDRDGRTVAAISVTYLADDEQVDVDTMRAAVIQAAAAASADFAGPGAGPGAGAPVTAGATALPASRSGRRSA